MIISLIVSSGFLGQDYTIILLLEPLHRLLSRNTMLRTDGGLLSLSRAHVETGSAQHHVEVQTIDADVRIVLNT